MRTLLIAITLFCSIHCFSQTSILAKDTLTLQDGIIYTGSAIGQNKDGELRFMTTDGVIHDIDPSSIVNLKKASTPAAGNKATAPATDNKPSPSTSNYKPSPSAINDGHIDWSDPTMPEKIIRKYRAGIGLTVAGTVMIVAGVAMLAAGIAANGQTTTVQNGYSVKSQTNVGAVGVVGVLSMIAGLPMMIVGAVKVAKSNKLARSRMTHLH